MTAESDLRPSIRIGSVVVATYCYMFSNMGGFIATAWPAVLGFAVVDAGIKSLAPQGGLLGFIFHVVVPTILNALLYAVFSAVWIRRVLLGERVAGVNALFYDKAVWRIILIVFKIWLALVGLGLSLWAVYSFNKAIFWVAIWVAIALLLWVGMRLTLAVPLAVVEGQSEFGRSWELTRGYMWSIFIGILCIVAASFLFVGAPIGFLKGFLKPFGVSGPFSDSAFYALMAMISLATGHTFAVFFFQRRCPPEPTIEGAALA